MPIGEIKFMRIPISGVKCEDCGKDLPFATWAHFQSDSKKAVCVDCGAKKGWTDKERATLLIKKLELQEDIKALRTRQKTETAILFRLTQEIDIRQLGKRWEVLEAQLHITMDTVQSYLDKIATREEATALQQVKEIVKETQETLKEIREELEMRLFLLDRSARKKKYPERLVDEDDAPQAAAEQEAEEQPLEVPQE